VIDPGHGGKDPGAVAGKGLYEKTVALAISLKVGEILKKRGYRVYFTRTTDKFIKLRDRTRFANKKNADLFISIHANSAKNEKLNGVETYFLSPARSERSKRVAALENKGDIEEMNYFSKATYLNVFNKAKIVASNKFAIDVQRGMISYLRDSYNVKDGGVREAPFWVLVGAQMPAILVEVGYISNRVEKKRIFTSRYQNLIARGIASGVDNYFLKNR
jgi:N-acetylmuramoyl-L-alanine amidase